MKTFSAACIIASTPLLALSSAHPARSPPAQCFSYILINTRGTGEPQTTSIGFQPMIADVLAAVPHGSKHDTWYPAAPDLTQMTTSIGINDISALIEDGLVRCPDQKYALLGYSQGATVTNRVLQKYPPSSTAGRAIVAVVDIGNPYHLPDRQGNVDENEGSATAGKTGSLVGVAEYGIPDAWYATGKIRDACFTDDSVCVGFSLEDLFSPAHFYYGFSESVQTLGANFLVEKLPQS